VRYMVGTWGLEPQTSTVSILRTVMYQMRTSERKLHERNNLPHFRLGLNWLT